MRLTRSITLPTGSKEQSNRTRSSQEHGPRLHSCHSEWARRFPREGKKAYETPLSEQDEHLFRTEWQHGDQWLYTTPARERARSLDSNNRRHTASQARYLFSNANGALVFHPLVYDGDHLCPGLFKPMWYYYFYQWETGHPLVRILLPGVDYSFQFPERDAPSHEVLETGSWIKGWSDRGSLASCKIKSTHQVPFRVATVISKTMTAPYIHHESHAEELSDEHERITTTPKSRTSDSGFRSPDLFGRRSLQWWKTGAGRSKSWKQARNSSRNGVPAVLCKITEWERDSAVNTKLRKRNPKELKKKKSLKQGLPKKLCKHDTQGASGADFQDWTDACSEIIMLNPHTSETQEETFMSSIKTKDDWDAFDIITKINIQPLPDTLSMSILSTVTLWHGQISLSETTKAIKCGQTDLENFVKACRDLAEFLAEDLRVLPIEVIFPPGYSFYWIMESIPFLQYLGFISNKEAESIEFILYQMTPMNETRAPTSASYNERPASLSDVRPGVQRLQQQQQPRKPEPHADGASHAIHRPEIGPACKLIPSFPKNYKWFPRSKKRRLRKGRQKELQKPSEYDSAKDRRKKLIRSGKSPYACCHLVRQSFSCGHVVRRLCFWCNDAWKRAEIGPCQLQTKYARGQCCLEDLYRHFSTPCDKCPWPEHTIPLSKNRYIRSTSWDTLDLLAGRYYDIKICCEDMGTYFVVTSEGCCAFMYMFDGQARWIEFGSVDSIDLDFETGLFVYEHEIIGEDDGDKLGLAGKNFRLPLYY